MRLNLVSSPFYTFALHVKLSLPSFFTLLLIIVLGLCFVYTVATGDSNSTSRIVHYEVVDAAESSLKAGVENIRRRAESRSPPKVYVCVCVQKVRNIK